MKLYRFTIATLVATFELYISQKQLQKMDDLQVENQWSEIGPAKKRTKKSKWQKSF